jgi:hypothetical protein
LWSEKLLVVVVVAVRTGAMAMVAVLIAELFFFLGRTYYLSTDFMGNELEDSHRRHIV